MNDDSKIIKAKNYQKIHALFYAHDSLSKPQIVKLTGMSMPTVSANIAALASDGLIEEGALLESSGGRPARGYRLVRDAKVAFGVEIKFDQVRCAVVDLLGEAHDIVEYPLPCSDLSSYLKSFCALVKGYIAASGYVMERVLGIGIAVQAVVDGLGSEMIYSRILPLRTLKAADLSLELGMPVRLCHDVECAALTELWHDPALCEAVYVSIAEHLGGALIHNHALEHGKKGYAGALEHLEVGHEGRLCYCGRQDCLETYCSLSALLSRKEKLRDFFKALRESTVMDEYRTRWQEYLKHLARGLYTVYLLLERDIILGGDLAPYLDDRDLMELEEQVISRGTFPIEHGFIRRPRLVKDAAVAGAALYFMREHRAVLWSLL
ncbi:MAG TPA: ROK family protein [Candidatus Avisuccinivibrio pullicola]|nr:ROK family protein [Candidatus Avisuccinivibrio pullicola]